MPLYEYMCGSCGHRFERIQKFSDPPVSDCPKCGQPVLPTNRLKRNCARLRRTKNAIEIW